MAKTLSPKRLHHDSFDVTCVIGTVEIGPNGTVPPHVAAFSLIAEHDAPGTYTFPMPNGDDCRVTVEHTSNPDDLDV